MRLTADAIVSCENYLNAYNDREINFRGRKIPAVENLAVLQDQYDTIDFSDNDIKKFDNFPLMRRLDTLLFHNNSISRVHPQIGNSLPNLTSLMLTNNKINNYYEVEHLSSLKKLSFLSLLENPLTFRQYYREFTIFKLPQLKVLDFQKITIKEKKNIKQFFETNPAGKQFLVQVENEKQSYYQQLSQRQQQNAIPAAVPPPASNPSPVAPTVSLTEEQKNQVRAAIENASTKEEIDRIEQQLKTGTFPFKVPKINENKRELENPQVDDAEPPAKARKSSQEYSNMDVID